MYAEKSVTQKGDVLTSLVVALVPFQPFRTS
jgi:hypothetical protein